jgi:hypothetical protein
VNDIDFLKDTIIRLQQEIIEHQKVFIQLDRRLRDLEDETASDDGAAEILEGLKMEFKQNVPDIHSDTKTEEITGYS